MIKNLLFDMGGVITLQDAAEAARRFRALGVDTDRFLGSYGHKGIFGALENGDITAEEFCVELAKLLGREEVTWDEACHCWMGFKKDAPMERLHFLLELKKQYHVCLLSNNNPFIMTVARTPEFCAEGKPITHYFHSLFCSYELNASKPGEEIFRKVLAADGMKAEECLFVDDSRRNIEAAEALGFHGLHVETNEDWRQPLMDLLECLNTTTPKQSKP